MFRTFPKESIVGSLITPFSLTPKWREKIRGRKPIVPSSNNIMGRKIDQLMKEIPESENNQFFHFAV